MKAYIRKIDSQCITHQISITREVVSTFFGNIPNNFVPDLLRMCGLQFLTYIAITSFFTMISMLVKQNGVALSPITGVICMIFSVVITIVVSLFTKKPSENAINEAFNKDIEDLIV